MLLALMWPLWTSHVHTDTRNLAGRHTYARCGRTVVSWSMSAPRLVHMARVDTRMLLALMGPSLRRFTHSQA